MDDMRSLDEDIGEAQTVDNLVMNIEMEMTMSDMELIAIRDIIPMVIKARDGSIITTETDRGKITPSLCLRLK